MTGAAAVESRCRDMLPHRVEHVGEVGSGPVCEGRGEVAWESRCRDMLAHTVKRVAQEGVD